MFVYYNPNPDNKSTSDCVIRSLSKVLNKDWEETYIALAIEGLLMHEMPSVNTVWGNYLKRHGFVRYVIPDSCPYCYTIKQFCYDHPIGTFVLGTGSHAVAVIDGDYYDSLDSGNEVPIYYWEKEINRS